MKKVNNRQNQVKSLDFTGNSNFLYNQGLQKSPKVLKSFMQQQVILGSNNKTNPQKSEITHYNKKNQVIPQQHQMSKQALASAQLVQVESTQSIKASPVKNDIIGVKNYPQSISKPSNHKTQKIKIGMHKKAVSLMGSNHTSQLSNLPGDNNILDYTKQSALMGNQYSQKQSYIPSQQTSFNDYNSNNNLQYNPGSAAEALRVLPKVDNFLLNDKNASILTVQQQQQMKTFQKILHDSQLSQDHINFNQEQNIKTFDQRPPINQIFSQNQSQRLSIASDTVQQPQAYRSHANSFKTGAQNTQITMKHPPNKYIKGNQGEQSASLINATVNQNSVINVQNRSKKTLQSHHQRTFSDNPNTTSNKNSTFSVNQNGQGTNRNFQELIRSANNKETQQNTEHGFVNTVGLSTTNISNENYPLVFSSTIVNPSQTILKNTIGSSRQSAQSQALLDEKEILLHNYQASGTGQEKYNDLKNIYHGVLKDQIQKTKNQLKLTQQQFGGPSRKVVQNNRMTGSANTQSYRQSQQNTLTGGSVSKIAMASDPKSTPKLHGKSSGKGSINQSQNLQSSQGTRTQTSTQLAGGSNHLVYSEKMKKQKVYKGLEHQSLNVAGSINFQPQMLVEMQNEHAKMTGKDFNKTGSSGHHKRSASDGSQAVFQSLSNRGVMNPQALQQQNISNQASLNQIYKGNNSLAQSISMGIPQSEAVKTKYSKQGSVTKMPQTFQIIGSGSNGKTPQMSEYNIVSERPPYSQSNVQVTSQNVMINSHRKISEGSTAKHQRHKSEQFMLDHSKTPQTLQQQQIQKKSQKIAAQQIQFSNREPIVANVHSGEMIIQDQSAIQSKHHTPVHANPGKPPIVNLQDLKQNSFYKQANQPSLSQLQPVQERIETQESAVSDPTLTPRSRMNFKLHKKVKIAFQKSQNPSSPTHGFTTTSDFYKIGKVMGKGAFGKVNLAIHRLSNKFVALKSINKQFLSEEASKRKVMQEFNILRRTRHINVVRLYESFETQQHIIFVMEVCGAGDLLTYVRRRRKLKEDVAKHMFKQIIEGLRYCHSKNILHRDIKLDNILLTSEGDIKICDFGVSKLVKNGEIMTEQCGTPAYIAPEVFENKGYEGYQSDIWSAGVVLYAMLYGTVPFKANNMTELQKQITKNVTTFKDEISSEAIALLKGILEKDPIKRMKVNDILRHPWMSDVPDQVNVFTDQEKEKVIQEFAYYNFKNDQNSNPGEVLHTDPFTEQMLNSTQNSLIKNASTKSIILAPFNSTRSHIDDNHHLHKSIQEMLVDKKQIKFAAKVKEVDRQYEQNNNAELDNGVYHQDSDEDEKKEEEKKEGKRGSLEGSFDQEDAYNDDGGKKKQSEWQKIEQMVIDRVKTEEEEEDKFNSMKHHDNFGSSQTLVVDDKLVYEIEQTGFPKNYIINSLNNDELNYVTTYYYLLSTQKEY